MSQALDVVFGVRKNASQITQSLKQLEGGGTMQAGIKAVFWAGARTGQLAGWAECAFVVVVIGTIHQAVSLYRAKKASEESKRQSANSEAKKEEDERMNECGEGMTDYQFKCMLLELRENWERVLKLAVEAGNLEIQKEVEAQIEKTNQKLHF